MVPPAGILIVLGQNDPVAAYLVDGADMLAVGTDHLGMFADRVQQVALALALGAERGELVVVLGLVLLAIFVIIAIELLQLLVALLVIVLVPAIAAAGAAALAGVPLAPTFGLLVTEPHLVPGAVQKATIIVPALRLAGLAAALLAVAIACLASIVVTTVDADPAPALLVAIVVATAREALARVPVEAAVPVLAAIAARLVAPTPGSPAAWYSRPLDEL